MSKKLLTIAVLPFVKAQVLKTLLEKEGIECILEDVNLLEGTSSLAVRVQILEDDLERAFPVLEEYLGKPGEMRIADTEPDRQILVPVDFSGYSVKAAKVAFDIARQSRSQNGFVSCLSQPDCLFGTIQRCICFRFGFNPAPRNCRKKCPV
jgi:hypothetical protein